MISPTGIHLVQMHEGYVALDTHYSNVPGEIIANPADSKHLSDPTHIRVYLSITPSVLGNLYATIRIDTAGGLFFNAPKGWFGYVTLRFVNYITNDESTNTNQVILQTYELVLPGFNIIHFFHDKKNSDVGYEEMFDRNMQYAIGYRQSDNAVCVIRSADYFTTWRVISYWIPGDANAMDPPGTLGIDNGGMLTFYIDKYGYMYVVNRPNVMISRDNASSWEQLQWEFQTWDRAQVTPFWNVTEDEENSVILFSEYGGAPNGPHHKIVWSSDSNRIYWYEKEFNWGPYRHIHGYHINPYNWKIHLLFLGDPPVNPNSASSTPGMYVSQDGGLSWSDEILHNINDGNFRNGPTMTTWWPSAPNGKAFISNDSPGKYGEWYGSGPIDWGSTGLKPTISLKGDIDELSEWPACPWGAMAVENSYETYCISNHDVPAWGGNSNIPNPANPLLPDPNCIFAYTPPSVLWRYDANPADFGITGIKTIMAYIYWPAVPFLYTSGGRGNVLPENNSDYIFSNAWGGIRIPRKVVKQKPEVLVAVLDSSSNIHSHSSQQ